VRRFAAATALVAALALSAGCSGGSDDPVADPSGSGTTTSAPNSTDPSASESTTGVELASGITLTLAHSSVQAPEGWKRSPDIVGTMVGASDTETHSQMSLGEIDAFGQTPDPDALADTAIAAGPYPTKPKKQPTTELDGVEVYHLAGQVQPRNYLEEFGAVVDDRIVTLTFQFSPQYSPEQRQEIVDSVTATFGWT
jgi:hypothetical protein